MHDECREQFASGVPLKKIARQTGVSVRTLRRWKKADGWIIEQQNINQDGNSFESKLLTKITEALSDSNLKPSRFKEILDAINCLAKTKIPSPAVSKETEYSRLTDEELDDKIAELQRFLASKPKDPAPGFDESDTQEPDSIASPVGSRPAPGDTQEPVTKSWWETT